MNRNYSDVYSGNDLKMILDADNAITKCKLWDWLRTYEPDVEKGFYLTSDPNLEKIRESMKYDGHSGSSYAWTMRIMELIAKGKWPLIYSDLMKDKIEKEKYTEEFNRLRREYGF